MCLGIPGEVIEVLVPCDEQGLRMARVRFGGITREVCLEATPEVCPGDFVLVHVGFAIARIDAAEARRAWEVLEVLGQTAEVRDGLPAGGESPGEPAAADAPGAA